MSPDVSSPHPSLHSHSTQGFDPAVQVKFNNLSFCMPEKFLVPNISLNISRANVPNITQMVLLFAPWAKPEGLGCMKKNLRRHWNQFKSSSKNETEAPVTVEGKFKGLVAGTLLCISNLSNADESSGPSSSSQDKGKKHTLNQD
ncbi:hypothetical protein DFH28DRAFT_931144 [Melampsora americana]|nr:hypothetical protein DFH28DRAFT_931144 [Melampsora americana]